jgi:hypothetical protein
VKVRVVTLNLLHGAPIPGARKARLSLEARLEWTEQRLKQENPDVVLLQEASVSPRSGNTAEALGHQLGLEFVYARANPTPALRPLGFVRKLAHPFAFEEGPAVLSRFPIIEHRVHRLSPRASVFERRIRGHARPRGGCAAPPSPRARRPAAARFKRKRSNAGTTCRSAAATMGRVARSTTRGDAMQTERGVQWEANAKSVVPAAPAQ